MNIIGIKILNTTHLYDDAVTNKHGQRTECDDRARNLKFIMFTPISIVLYFQLSKIKLVQKYPTEK